MAFTRDGVYKALYMNEGTEWKKNGVFVYINYGIGEKKTEWSRDSNHLKHMHINQL